MPKKRSKIWYTVGPKDTPLITRVTAVFFRPFLQKVKTAFKNARSSAVFVQFCVFHAKLHENCTTASVFEGGFRFLKKGPKNYSRGWTCAPLVLLKMAL